MPDSGDLGLVPLSDEEFWRLVVGLSEPAKRTPATGLVSNEHQFQCVVPKFSAVTAPGRAYLGVGPEQNFTYIAALQPAIAFIVDHRHTTFCLHLLHKALFEMADSRVDYLETLFSRSIPAEHRTDGDIGRMLDALTSQEAEMDRIQATLSCVRARLCDVHRFPVSTDDLRSLEEIVARFARHGPGINCRSTDQDAGPGQPSFSELMRGCDRWGVQHSYLSSDERYERVRELHRRNRIVPVTGDFAGPRSLRAIGAHLQACGMTVAAFYLSNVEYFLQQEGRLDGFRDNLAALPADHGSRFIRPTLSDSGRQLPGLKAEIGEWDAEVAQSGTVQLAGT